MSQATATTIDRATKNKAHLKTPFRPARYTRATGAGSWRAFGVWKASGVSDRSDVTPRPLVSLAITMPALSVKCGTEDGLVMIYSTRARLIFVQATYSNRSRRCNQNRQRWLTAHHNGCNSAHAPRGGICHPIGEAASGAFNPYAVKVRSPPYRSGYPRRLRFHNFTISQVARPFHIDCQVAPLPMLACLQCPNKPLSPQPPCAKPLLTARPLSTAPG